MELRVGIRKDPCILGSTTCSYPGLDGRLDSWSLGLTSHPDSSYISKHQVLVSFPNSQQFRQTFVRHILGSYLLPEPFQLSEKNWGPSCDMTCPTTNLEVKLTGKIPWMCAIVVLVLKGEVRCWMCWEFQRWGVRGRNFGNLQLELPSFSGLEKSLFVFFPLVPIGWPQKPWCWESRVGFYRFLLVTVKRIRTYHFCQPQKLLANKMAWLFIGG